MYVRHATTILYTTFEAFHLKNLNEDILQHFNEKYQLPFQRKFFILSEVWDTF